MMHITVKTLKDNKEVEITMPLNEVVVEKIRYKKNNTANNVEDEIDMLFSGDEDEDDEEESSSSGDMIDGIIDNDTARRQARGRSRGQTSTATTTTTIIRHYLSFSSNINKAFYEISEEEYNRIRAILRQMNKEELGVIEQDIKIEAVREEWSKRNQALMGMDLDLN